MNIVDVSWEQFINRRTKKLVCFGAGMLPRHLDSLFADCRIWDDVVCFIDNNTEKNGTVLGVGTGFPVLDLDSFESEGISDFSFLITCEAFEPICSQLNLVKKWTDVDCYIYVKLNKSLFSSIKQPKYDRKEVSVPKKIHYCWFGKKEPGLIEQRCIESWRKWATGYEIIKWNEENFNININSYVRQAYEAGRWAFVSDYARLDILYQYGGIYLDTDVELIKNLDYLPIGNGFISYGEWPALNSGAGVGCMPGDFIIKQMRDDPRSSIHFINNGKIDRRTNSIFESNVLRKYGLRQNFEMQEIGMLRILPPDYMAPESVLGINTFITHNTVGIHHCLGSWAETQRITDMRRTREKMRVEN